MAIQNMFDALVARSPNITLAENAGEFARLIGSWNVQVLDAERDGSKRVSQGEWHFGWALEGRAIQDVLIVPERKHRGRDMPTIGNRYMTTLRVFDSREVIWRTFTIDPLNNVYLVMAAREIDGRIALEGSGVTGDLHRVTLSDISQNSFKLSEERAEGENWAITMELEARRAA